MELAPQNPFSSLMPYLKNSIEELDIDASGKVIKKADAGSQKLESSKLNQIKAQFIKCVQLCQQAPSSADSSNVEGIRKEVLDLEQAKQKVVFMQELSKSPLAKELFPNADDVATLSKQLLSLQQSFANNLNMTLLRFKDYSDLAPISQFKELQDLNLKMNHLDAKDPAHADIRYHLDKALKKKQEAQTLSQTIKEKLPDLDQKISSLSKEDLELFLLSMVSDFSIFGHDIKPAVGFHASFLATCSALDQLQDPDLRKSLKELIFSMPRCYKVSFAEILIKLNGKKELNEIYNNINQIKENFYSSSWLNILFREAQLLPEKERAGTLLESIKILVARKDKLSFYYDQPMLEGSTLFKTDPALFIRLHSYPTIRFLDVSSLSEKKARTLDQCLSKVPALTACFFIDDLNGRGFSEEQLMSFLDELAAASPDIAEKAMNLFQKWRKSAPAELNDNALRLFTRRPIDKMLQDVETLLSVVESCGGQMKAIDAHFESHPSPLFTKLFKYKEDPAYWINCQQSLDKYPELVPIFEKWIEGMFAYESPKKGAWFSDVIQSHPEFKKLLSQLFEIEKQQPQIFQLIVQTFPHDPSMRTLSVLIALFFHFDQANTSALLHRLHADPQLLAYLPRAFVKDSFGSSKPFKVSNDFARIIHRLDPELLSFMLKESHDLFKLNGMVTTFLASPVKMQLIKEIETSPSAPRLLKGFHLQSYGIFDIKTLEFLRNHPAVCEAVAKYGFENIPWNQIPEEIWSFDPELPVKLLELRDKLKKEDHSVSASPMSIRALLVGVGSQGKQALAYRILDLKEGMNHATFEAMIGIVQIQGEDIGKTCLETLTVTRPGTPDRLTKHFRDLGLLKLMELLEIRYGIDESGTLEQRMQQLPIRWRWTLLQLVHAGLSHPDHVQALATFALKHSQIAPLEKMCAALKVTATGTEATTISALDRYPAYAMEIAKEPNEWNNAIQNFDTLYKNQDSSFAYLLGLPDRWTVRRILMNLHSQPKLLPGMIEWDRHLAPPPGKVFADGYFDKEIREQLETNPNFAKTIEWVGLSSFKKEFHASMGDAYLYLLRADQRGKAIQQINQNPVCLKWIKELDWKKLSHPDRFAEQVITLATLNQTDSLIKILQWMTSNDYNRGEALLDMAKAGYIPEAVQIVERHQKEPNSPEALRLLKLAGSKNASAIQRYLQGLPEEAAKFPPAVPAAVDASSALNAIQAQVESLKKVTFKDDAEKQRALETEYSLAIANQLVVSSGIHYGLIPALHQLIASQPDFSPQSDFAVYLKTTLAALESDQGFSDILASIEMSSENQSPAVLIVRKMLHLSENEALTHRHAQVAALSAILTRTRQSIGVGSCFGTSWAIVNQSDKDKLKHSLEDYRDLLRKNALTRKSSGKAPGTYSYPLSLMPKRMKELILTENLLLKGRENVLASMGSHVETKMGLLRYNLACFENNRFYGNMIENSETLAVKPPVEASIVLNELRLAFNQKAKAVVQYEEPHPISKKLGWWQLERRDKNEVIGNLKSYQELHLEIIETAHQKMLTAFPQHKIFLDRLFTTFKEFVTSEEFIDQVCPTVKLGKPIEQLEETPWMQGAGGFPEAVIAADLQFERSEMPYKDYHPQNPEDMLRFISFYCDALPEYEKNQFLNQPERLCPMSTQSHALTLKPASIIGKSSTEIIAKLNKPSGACMDGIADSARKKWMENWISVVPRSVEVPFKNAISAVNWEQMTVEECGKAMMECFVSVYGLKPDFGLLSQMENQFFKELPSELQKKMAVQIVGDLNWDNARHHNNEYLACARSPLTGKLAWYICDRHGDHREFYPYAELYTEKWSIMEPLSRKVNGVLSYQ